MAVIDPKKLLPSAKKSENSEKFLVPISSIVLKKNVAISSKLLKPEAQKDDGKGGAIVYSKLVDKIIKVESILKSNLVSQISQQNKKEKEEKRKEAEEREKKLEIKPENKGKVPLPSLPRIGFLDALRNYFTNTLLGFIAVKLFDMAPKLIKFLDAIKPVAGFIGEFAGNLFNGLVEFVDKGYNAYDEVQKFVKSVGGENYEKLFNDFSKNLNLALNGAIVASMIAISTAPKGPRRLPGATGAGRGGAAKVGVNAGSNILKKGAAQQTTKQVATQGAKQSARFAITRAPIIGALIGFIIDTVIFRESPTRAAAGAVGNAIGSAVGAGLLGGGTFGLGAGVGLFVGGFVGDWIGKALYDTLTGYKQEPIQAKAQGGVVSSGAGKTPSRRGIKVQKAKPKRIITQKTQPGKDIGGLKKIEELYGEDKPGTRSALRALKKSSEDVKRMRSLNGLSGAMFGAGIDMALGQKPDKNLSTSLGSMFGAVIQTAIDSELNNTFGDITKSIAMAGGGVVPSRELKSNMSIGERIGRYISSALAVSIESSAAKILQNLNKELRLEGGPAGDGGGGDGGDGAGGYAQGEENFVSSKDIYSYLSSKGIPHNHIMGMLANIQAESSFNAGAIGDNGTSGGLFQHHKERFTGMVAFAGKDWAKNWKRQIDYALREDAGKQYTNQQFKTPEEASSWFTLNFERPSNKESKAKQRLGNLKNFGPDGSWKGGGSIPYVKPNKNIKLTFIRGLSKDHGGADIAADEGTPLRAISDGTIVESGVQAGGKGWGNFIVYKDDKGIYHLYGHLQNGYKKGGSIKKGDIIAKVGMTGTTTGPHLHWETGTGWDGTITGRFEPRNRYSINAPFFTEKVSPPKQPQVSPIFQQDKNKPSPIFNFNSQSSIQTPLSSTSQQVASLVNFSKDKTGISNISQSVSNFSEASEGSSSSTLAIQEIHYVYG
jgi:murein DD-endopeptidase MepM/ murein hydrolase activator NlpD